jgi:predicted KAP-like P-loop ATPase
MNGDGKSTRLFKEFAKAIHWKNHLVWSKGLRAQFGFGNEKPEIQIASVQSKEDILFANIPNHVWRKVRVQEKQSELLQVCRGGIENLHKYLMQFATSPKSGSKSKRIAKQNTNCGDRQSLSREAYCSKAEARRAIAVQKRLQGESYRKIAASLDCSASEIHRLLNDSNGATTQKNNKCHPIRDK